MKLLALAIFLIFPITAMAQDGDWQISGEIRVKQFLLNDEPDLIKTDYASYDAVADQELGLFAHFHFFNKLELDAYPYFWYSDENRVARVGLKGEAKYEIWNDYLKIGYGHHSLHNADVDSPHQKGRVQDWLLLDFQFWNPEIESLEINFSLIPRIFLNNSEPINKKVVYDNDEPEAFGELTLAVKAHYWKLDFDIRPYVQFASNHQRYGATAEIRLSLTDYFSFFADSKYYDTDYENSFAIAVGIILKFN